MRKKYLSRLDKCNKIAENKCFHWVNRVTKNRFVKKVPKKKKKKQFVIKIITSSQLIIIIQQI